MLSANIYADNTLQKIEAMKNIVLLLIFSMLTLFACKKRTEAPVNKLIPGLDPSVTLPNADTTGALFYIEGYIDGERFCLAEGKDSIQVIDYATEFFYYDTYQKDWINGITGAWFFHQGALRGFQEPPRKGWDIKFYLPTFDPKRDKSEFRAFQRKYATPSVFTNFDKASTTDNQDQFDFIIQRTDLFDGQWQTYGLTCWGYVSQGVKMDQTGSYIKLVSVRKFNYVPTTDYHYEMIYEFDLKLSGNRHLTKGRMKTWVTRINP